MKTKFMRALALVLAMVLLVTGVPTQAFAEPIDGTAQETIQETEQVDISGEGTTLDGQETTSPDDTNVQDPEQTVKGGAVTDTETQETVSDNLVTDETKVETTVSANTVSANTISGTEGEFYRSLTADEMSAKAALSSDVSVLGSAQEGTDYVSKELIYLCDTEEEAKEAATAYHAIVKSFQYGVAVLEIQESAEQEKGSSVLSAVTKAADATNNLPAVYPNYLRHTCSVNTNNEHFNDPFTKTNHDMFQWYHEKVNSKFVWEAEEQGTIESPDDIVVAVIDTGINTSHQDLSSIIVEAKSVVDGHTELDENGHGSNVAGIIANIANTVGGRGVAEGVKVMAIRVSQRNTSGKYTGQDMGAMSDAAILAALNYAAGSTKNVRVINMSLGGTYYSSSYEAPIKNAREKGIVIVASAGNSNSRGDFYPAYMDGVISVAALNSNMKKASFSNYSPKVDISAPGGEGTADAKATDFYRLEELYASYKGEDNAYSGMCGTSQAAPVVAATAALVIKNVEDYESNRSELTADRVEECLESTAQKISTGYATGAGCVDAAAALGLDTTVSEPVSNIASGQKIASGTTITLDLPDDHEDAVIYYTINGKIPSSTDMEKTGTFIYDSNTGISLNGKGSVTVKAFALLYGKISKTASYTYKYDDSLVGSVTVTSKTGSGEIGVGKKLKLQTEVLPIYAKNQKLVWSSSDTALATVSTAGEVTALAEGDVTITAITTDGSNIQTPFAVTIKPLATAVVGSSDAEYNPCNLAIGQEYSIADSYMIYPSEASQAVTYASSNNKVVTVDSVGLLKAVGSGKATVTFTAADGSGFKDSYQVQVTSVADELVITDKAGLDKTATTLTPVVTYKRNGTVIKPDDSTLSWSFVNGGEYASINPKTGVVKVNGGLSSAQSVKIRAQYQSIYADYDFMIYPLTTGFSYKSGVGNTLSITSGYPLEFKDEFINVAPSATMDVYKYTSSNPSVVSVNATTGHMCTIKPGKATITMTAQDGSKKSCKINFTVYNRLSGVSISNKGNIKVLYPGKSITYEAVASPSTEKLASPYQYWLINNSTVENEYLKIQKGKVTAKSDAAGITDVEKYDICYRYYPSYYEYLFYYNSNYHGAVAAVEVYPAGTTRVNIPTTLNINGIGEKETLTPTSIPDNACQKYYTYTTSNAKVAKVYTDGTILAVGNGTANITVTAGDGSGKKAVCKVTVAQPVTDITVSSKNNQTVLGAGKSLQMTATTNTDAKNKAVTWSVDNTSAATISTKGVLKAKTPLTFGTRVTVTATAADGSGIFNTMDITLYPLATSLTGVPKTMELGTVDVGAYQTEDYFSIQVAPDTACRDNFTVTSSKPAVATATRTGDIVTVTAVSKGTTDIKVVANDGSGKSATCKVTVVKPVESITIASKTGSSVLAAGKSMQFSAVVDAAASNKGITWEFINPESMNQYATLNAKNGTLQAKSNFNEVQFISVKAKAADKSGLESSSLSVALHPTAIASIGITDTNDQPIPKNTVVLYNGNAGGDLNYPNSRGFKLTGVDDLEKFSVTSSNNAIADVTKSGCGFEVTASGKAGTAKVTVKALDGSGKSATLTVTVRRLMDNLYVKSSTGIYDLASGKTLQMSATTSSDATNKKITWDLNDEDKSFASISQRGVLTANKELTAIQIVTVKANAVEGIAEGLRQVTLYPATTTVSITGSNTISVGSNAIITVAAPTTQGSDTPCQKFKVTYTTGSIKVYQTNGSTTNYKVVGLKKGTGTITATALDGSGKKATFKVTVQ